MRTRRLRNRSLPPSVRILAAVEGVFVLCLSGLTLADMATRTSRHTFISYVFTSRPSFCP